jgi:sugar phosphate isomerase/epimerase
MKIGLGTYALAWSIGVPGSEPQHPMDIYGFLDFAKKHGFQLVQIADNIPLDQFTKKELEELRQKADLLGIAIEVGTRGMTLENVRRYLQIAKILSSPILRIVIDQKGFEPDLLEIHQIVDQLIPDLEASRIKLAIENHDRLKASEFLEIMEDANSSWVGICLDSVNSIGADEGFDSVFKTLAPYTINLHLKDYTIQRKSHMMGFDITGAPAGQGRLDIHFILKILEAIGKCKSMILESWPAPEKSIEQTIIKEQEWVKQGAQFLFENFKD